MTQDEVIKEALEARLSQARSEKHGLWEKLEYIDSRLAMWMHRTRIEGLNAEIAYLEEGLEGFNDE